MNTPSFLAKSSITFFVSIDIRGRIIQANDFLQQTVPSFNAMAAGKKALDMVIPDDQAAFLRALEQCFLSDRSHPVSIQFRIYRPGYVVSATSWEFTRIGGKEVEEPYMIGIGQLVPEPQWKNEPR